MAANTTLGTVRQAPLPSASCVAWLAEFIAKRIDSSRYGAWSAAILSSCIQIRPAFDNAVLVLIQTYTRVHTQEAHGCQYNIGYRATCPAPSAGLNLNLVPFLPFRKASCSARALLSRPCTTDS